MFLSRKILYGSVLLLTALLTATAILGVAGCSSPSNSDDTYYTVTFDAQGGAPAPAPQTVVSGGKAATPSPAPAKTGYVLEGWHTDAAHTNRWDFAVDTVTANITLHAKWIEKAEDDPSKEALQEAGEIILTAKDSNGEDVELALEIGDDTITIAINGGEQIEYPVVITDSVIILEGAGNDGGDVSLGYVINDDRTLAITSGLDQIKDADLSGDPVVSQPNENLEKPDAPDAFVPVTNITGVPTGGAAGTQVDLSAAAAVPNNATNKTIAWSVKDPGGTGVSAEGIVNNKFTPAAAGTLTLTATIANGKAQGENYTKDFAIAIAPADTFVAVTDISGVPTGATAGAEADLSYAEVAPSNADNKTIAWSVKDPGGTGVTTAGIVNGKFTPTAAGTLTLTATIANGKAQGENYAKDFTIVIAPAFVAVTGISNVPTGGTEGSEVDLSYATVAPDNATNKTIVWTVKDAGTTGVGDASITAGKFTPASAGTLTLTATIANGTAPGTPFATEFDIIIAPLNTFVAVTNITGVPDGTDAGSEVDLSYATVVPDNADNQDIVWTVKDAGTTGLATADIVDGKFTAPLPGSVKLTATIANGTAEGTDYTKEFTIIISVPGSFVAVTSITGVPSEGVVGTLVSLANAAAVPSTATYKTISWVVKTAGAGVTSIAGNSFTPTATGKVTLTARILSGAAAMQPYTKDFEITINPAFVAVTGINGLPDTLNAVTGVAIDLNAGISVAPTDATNKTIAWSVKTPGDTGLTDTAVASGVFTPANAGTVTLTATILNGTAQGTNYTQDIAITIIKPVTAIAGVPTNGTRGYAVSLVGAVAQPADATNKTPIVWSVKTAGAGVATITGTSFTPTSTGTVTLTATIANGSALGTAFAREFTITISEPGTTSPEIGLPEYPSIVLMDKDNKPLPLDEPIPVELNSSYYVVISSDYTNIAWYLNGTKEEAVTGTLIYLPTTTARTIKLFVEGKKNGRLETGNYTFQVASSN